MTATNETVEAPGAAGAAGAPGVPGVDEPGAEAAVERPVRFRGGWRIVARKEFTDHVSSVRFVILVVLLALAGLAAVHSASGPIRDTADEASLTPAIFLYLFTLSPERVPAFHEFLGILGPLLGIAFGFDAINGERSQGTLPRLVSQPIHRDEIINGKFVAGLAAIALVLASLIAIVSGYGAWRLGIGPTPGDVVRLFAFFVVAMTYIAFWLALSLWLSVVSRRAATAAMAAIAIWLVLALFFGLIAGIIADSVSHVPADASPAQVLDNARTELRIRRISPDQLYTEATAVLLNPARQSTGIVITEPATRALPSRLPLADSLNLAWWQLVVLVALTIVMFTGAYTTFMRQEVRA
jgi:ABC-2 type transport system permease protein